MMQTLKARDWFGDSELPFRIDRHKVSGPFPYHKHEFFEFFYVWDGELQHHIDGHDRCVRRGDIVLMNPSRRHAFETLPGHEVETVQSIFMPAFLNVDHRFLRRSKGFTELIFMAPFYDDGCVVFHLAGRTELKVRTLLEELLDEYHSRPRGFETAIRTKLTDLFISVSRAYEQEQSVPPARAPQFSATVEIILDTVAYIEEHYTEPLRLEEIAHERAGVTREYYSRVLRNLTGMTFSQYITGLRLKRARELLITTDDKVISVALDAGFNDLSHFNRTFKKEVGQTPSEYRKGRKD